MPAIEELHTRPRPPRGGPTVVRIPPGLLQAVWWWLTIAAAGGAAAGMQTAAADLADLTLEQLGNVVVTSVSRRPQPIGRAAASIYVISHEDIRRSGVTSLPEALRLAPNLHVGRADVNQYGITARGSNSVLNNKMLVMIDGRTVYSPIFSGVFWESIDVLLEDIDRIEVISGPGATLWGLNAVNGVINVITRRAEETQGVFAEAGAGNRELGASARYGSPLAAGAVRVYAKGVERHHGETPRGVPVRDESDRGQAGFRYDSASAGSAFTLQGDAYRVRVDQAPSPREVSGANLLTRWSTPLGEGSDVTLQAYYDHAFRDQPGLFRQSLDTLDVTAQFGTRPLTDHRLLLGGGYRYARDRTETPGPALAFIPGNKSLAWGHAFAQDEIALHEDLQLTLGAKVETNVYTGAEFLPNVRLAWQAAPQRLLWSAVSRAVRAPARIDRDLYQPARAPHFVLNGGPRLRVRDGQCRRTRLSRAGGRLGLPASATLFHNDFDRLRSCRAAHGRTARGEHAAGPRVWNRGVGEWRVRPSWRLALGAVRQHVEFEREPGSTDVAGLASLTFDPTGWWTFRSSLDVMRGVEFDVLVRRVGGLPSAGSRPTRPSTRTSAGADSVARTLAHPAERLRPRACRVGAGGRAGGAPARRLHPGHLAPVKPRRASRSSPAPRCMPCVRAVRTGAARGPGGPTDGGERTQRQGRVHLPFPVVCGMAVDSAAGQHAAGHRGLGADDVAQELEQLVRDRKSDDRPIAVRRLAPGDTWTGLHVLYLGQDAVARAQQVMKALQDRSVLTISDVDGAVERGIVIGLVQIDSRLRFEVNAEAAERSGLKLSSRLLTVALRVRPGPR